MNSTQLEVQQAQQDYRQAQQARRALPNDPQLLKLEQEARQKLNDVLNQRPYRRDRDTGLLL